MGTKRPHDDHGPTDHLEKRLASRLTKRFKQTPRPDPPTSFPPAVNRLKNKIRDLTRVLGHEDHLPADVRIEKERALAGYKQDLERAEEEKRTKALIGRYHMVRFFERQKATRHLKKAKRRLRDAEADTPEHAEALEDVHIAEVNLNYTQYCPLNTKYKSVYPREAVQGAKLTAKNHGMKEHGNGGEAEDVLASRPAMWRIVEDCMKDGTLEALRDGKMTSGSSVGMMKSVAVQKHAKGSGGGIMLDSGKAKSSKGRKARATDQEDESDGGFFEE